MNRLIFAFFTLLITGQLSATEILNEKLSLRFNKYLLSEEFDQQHISIFVEADAIQLEEWLLSNGGIYKYGTEQYHHIQIQTNLLASFCEEDFVIRIEDGFAQGFRLLDTALIHNNVLPVHNGMSPLLNAYTGKDVIVGVIDDGIDYKHEDFKDSKGNTRIRYIWDQTVSSGNAPLPYTYGREWSWIDINATSISHTEQNSPYITHGSHVTGIAAGNGRAVGDYKGIAPESEIIAVSINYNGNFFSNVVDAVQYIFDKADALGKPCVINTSIGTYFGSHDGKDIPAQLIADMIREKPGRALVAACGNAGNIPFHLGYDVTPDSSFTWFTYNSSLGEVYFDLWADTADFNGVSFSIGVDDAGSFNLLGETPYFSPSDFNFNGDKSDLKIVNLSNPSSLGQVLIRMQLIDTRYYMEVSVSPTNTNTYWRFTTKGSGSFDVWSQPNITGTSAMISSGIPSFPNYKFPDIEKTMVSSWQNTDEVIAVANYVNRRKYLSIDSNKVRGDSCTTWPGCSSTNYFPGQLNVTSSLGPSRDGRVKPDIAATGTTVIATGNKSTVNLTAGNNNRYKVGAGGKHMRNSGTSMASPMVAGTIALYFEKDPNASASEVKQVLQKTARSDNFTSTSLPNNKWGFGKLNTFDALTYPVMLGCTDTAAFNYDPSSNIDDGNCIAKVYGCTDSTALNYNPSANIDDGNCDYKTPAGIQTLKKAVFLVYPNPSSGILNIEHIQTQFNGLTVQILDMNGKVVKEEFITGQQRMQIDISRLERSIYQLLISDGMNNFEVHKITKL